MARLRGHITGEQPDAAIPADIFRFNTAGRMPVVGCDAAGVKTGVGSSQ